MSSETPSWMIRKISSNVPNEGVTDELWAEMVAYAQGKSLKAGDYKNLNLPFENKLLAQPGEIRERMAKACGGLCL